MESRSHGTTVAETHEAGRERGSFARRSFSSRSTLFWQDAEGFPARVWNFSGRERNGLHEGAQVLLQSSGSSFFCERKCFRQGAAVVFGEGAEFIAREWRRFCGGRKVLFCKGAGVCFRQRAVVLLQGAAGFMQKSGSCVLQGEKVYRQEAQAYLWGDAVFLQGATQ